MNKIVLTGFSGNIGRHFLKYFIKKKYNIILIATNKKKIKITKNSKIKFLRYSCLQRTKVEDHYNILYLDLGKKFNLSKKDILKNINKTKKILKFAKLNKIKSFFYISSLAVFDNQKDLVIDKTSKPFPKTKYGESKILNEKLISEFCIKNNISYQIIRIPAVYGVKLVGIYKILNFFIKLGFPIPIFKKNNKRSYLDINLLLTKFNKILLSKENLNKVIYIADKVNYNLETFLGKVFNKKLKTFYPPLFILNLLNIFHINLKFYNKIIIKHKF